LSSRDTRAREGARGAVRDRAPVGGRLPRGRRHHVQSVRRASVTAVGGSPTYPIGFSLPHLFITPMKLVA